MKADDIFWIWLVTTIQNLGMMAAWTVLAIFFGKWWIALFAIFCLRSITAREAGAEDKKDDTLSNLQ